MGNWHLNDGYHLNEEDFRLAEFSFEGDAMLDVSFDVFSELEAEFFISSDWEYTHSVALDLLPMFPEKFHSSQILIDFVKELSIQVGSWLTSTRDITQLLNPNTITSIKYLRLLGDLIAVDFPDEDDSSQTEIKKTLQQAVDWYKIKGTYKAIQIAAAISSFTINLYDMYTNDYENFYLTDWFVGDEDENPPGFDSTYYKSPHFGLEVVLGQLFTDDSSLYLFQSGAIDTMIERIEKIRPVHTVPHYILKLNPKTDEFGNVVEVENYTYARITSNWEISQKYFDDQSSSGSWDFDSGSVYFDQNNTSFIKPIYQ